MKFTIEKVGKLTGLSAMTLRNWEKRYGFPRPERACSGHRFYCCEDIEFLKNVKELLNSGHNLSQIAEFYKQSHVSEGTKKPASPSLVDDVEYRVQLLYKSLIQFNAEEALGHYNILNSKLSPDKFFDRVIEVTLKKLGDEWMGQKISIAQEHFASSFFRMRLMSFLCLDLPVARPIKVLAATLSGERHEGGLLLVSSHLKFRGYAINYFGPDLPSDQLQELVKSIKPQCVLLSYNDPRRFQDDLKMIEGLGVPVCVGGIAFSDPQMKQKISKKNSKNLFVSDKTTGSEAASFVEMICQAD